MPPMRPAAVFAKMVFVYSLRLLCLAVLLNSCAYHFGNRSRVLPGGYELVAIPAFVNRSAETGIEVAFTNELMRNFNRSKIARVTPKDEAQVTLLGSIVAVNYDATATRVPVNSFPSLPSYTSLVSGYRVTVVVNLTLQRNSDHKELWTGEFSGESTYNAPQVLQAGLNTVNPLYNQSARITELTKIAKDMMSEAHDRITENF